MAKHGTGAYLKELREFAGKNQSQVAAKVGVDRSFISLAENEHYKLAPEDYAKAEAYLKEAAEKRFARARTAGIGQEATVSA